MGAQVCGAVRPERASAEPPLPRLIQGGMGIGVSGWRLAKAVAARGHLGVVSATAIDTVLVRRLQDGDPGGHVRRAIAHFPIPDFGQDVIWRYFRPEGRAPGEPYALLTMYAQHVGTTRERLAILGAFVEVFLAREGHDGPVGVNLLTKIQAPNLALLYGAMLAGVDYVIMGAGIPREIPAVLDGLAAHRPVSMRFDVEGPPDADADVLTFDPARHWSPTVPLVRPRFLAIIAATSLATVLARKANGHVDGFVVEGPTAGGHNAPPRGGPALSESGEPVYGARDVVDLAKLRELGRPFWLAGGMGSAGALHAALAEGAAGVQVGTLFAFCDESGVAPELKRRVLSELAAERTTVFTDPVASPTGYPFKRLRLVDEGGADAPRTRICDLGYLRTAVRRDDGRVQYRCAGEPVDQYVAKGGDPADTVGRQCLCNGLLATIGLAQTRANGVERPLITSGDDRAGVRALLDERESYGANDVIDFMLADVPASSR